MVLRSVPAVLLLFGSGCTDPAPAAGVEDPETVAPSSEIFTAVLAEGTRPWHVRDASGLEFLVFQATGFCFNTETQEVAPWMFHLSERLSVGPVPRGTLSIEVTATWSLEDYAGDALRIVARPPGADGYTVSTALASGVVTTIPVSDVGWDPSSPAAWDFWICTVQTTPDLDPRARPTVPFVGDIDVRLVAVR